MYIPQYPETERIRNQFEPQEQSILVPYPENSLSNGNSSPRKAFSLARFIPLLQERIYVVSPFTRSYLVSWITVLDSVPELELVSYLPDFLDGLLSVPLKQYPPATETIHPGSTSPTPPRMSASLPRTSWQTSFARYVTSVLCFTVRKKMQNHRNNVEQMKSFQISRCLIRNVLCSYARTMSHMITTVNRANKNPRRTTEVPEVGSLLLWTYLYSRVVAWVPGQGVRIDYAAIIEILIQQLDGQRWLHIRTQSSDAEFTLQQMTKFSNPQRLDGWQNSWVSRKKLCCLLRLVSSQRSYRTLHTTSP